MSNNYIYNEAQLEAINHVRGNCAVLATAGSGKTSVIAERVRKLVLKKKVTAGDILVLTFNKDAAELLAYRIGTTEECSDVKVMTFHALGYNIICRHMGCKVNLLTDTQQEDLMREVLLEQGEPFDCENVRSFLSFVSSCKNKGTDIDSLPEYLYRKVFRNYEDKKTKLGFIDFDDLLINSVQILKEFSTARKKLNYKYIIVDEAQDVNCRQIEILELLNKNNNLFVVGDMLQGIYEWRGSDGSYLGNFADTHKNAKIVKMNVNYRCKPEIVSYANKFAESISDSENKHYLPPISVKPAGGAVIVKRCDDELDEAELIADIYRNKPQGETMCVLGRTNSQLIVLENILSCKGIPIRYKESESYLNIPIVKTILSYLKLIDDCTDNAAFLNTINTPSRLLEYGFIAKLKKADAPCLYDAAVEYSKKSSRHKCELVKFLSYIGNLKKAKYKKVSTYINRLVKDLMLVEYFNRRNYATQEDICNFEAVKTLLYISKNYSTINDFLIAMKNNADTHIDGLDFMTIHKSKGLEFDTVVIVGTNTGVLPHWRNNNLEEEKRLFYVACTRAKNLLYILSPRFVNGERADISPFIERGNV